MLFLISMAQATNVVYLHKDGGHFKSGKDDDSARNTSSVLLAQRVPELEVAPFRPGDKVWADTVTCVRQRLADFDVRVVTERPSAGDYAMVVVGAERKDLKTEARGGLGPGATVPKYRGIAFTFTGGNALFSCSTIVHEYGHVMGLDHVYLWDDVMGHGKWNQNQSSVCGKRAPRACHNGEATQNSWKRMVDALGLANRVKERPKDVVPVSFHTPHPGECDGSGGPDLEVKWPKPGWLPTYARGESIDVTVQATDSDGVNDVHLVVAIAPDGVDEPSNASLKRTDFRENLSFACSDGKHGTLTCERTGDTWRFTGRLATGLFRVRLVAQDSLGHRKTYERYARVE